MTNSIKVNFTGTDFEGKDLTKSVEIQIKRMGIAIDLTHYNPISLYLETITRCCSVESTEQYWAQDSTHDYASSILFDADTMLYKSTLMKETNWCDTVIEDSVEKFIVSHLESITNFNMFKVNHKS